MCVFLLFFFSLHCIGWFLWEKGKIDRKVLVEYITSGFCQKYHLATFLLSLTCRLWFVDTIISMHGYQYAAGHIRVPLHYTIFLNPPLELCVRVCVCSFLRGINKILKKIIYLRNGRINTNWIAIKWLHLPDDGDGNDKTAADGTYLCWYVHSFVPPNVDVEMDQLIESSYPVRLIRLLHQLLRSDRLKFLLRWAEDWAIVESHYFDCHFGFGLCSLFDLVQSMFYR